MKERILTVVLAGMLLAATATAVQAAPVTYYFSGVLNDPFGTLPVGTPFCGSFTYDDAQPLNTPLITYRGDYHYTNFSVTIGSVTVTDSGTGPLHVFDNPYPTDYLFIYTFGVTGSFGGLTLTPGAGMSISLQDLNRVVWSSPAIPGPGLSLSNFTTNPSSHATFLELRSALPNPFGTIARGELTALSNTPVPACSLCLAAPSGMVAWYPFDEPSGVLSAAEFVNWNNGIRINGPTSIPAVVSNGLNFDGINDYVESPNQAWLNPGTGNLSIDAWIKVSPAAITIVDKRSGAIPTMKGYTFFVQSGRLWLQLANGLPPFPGFTNYSSPVLAPSITNGNWHHVAVTVARTSPTGITWYHNGVAVGNSNPTNRTGSLTNLSPLRIGTRTANTPLTAWFKGGIDELEIFNTTLSSTNVSNIFTAGAFGKCKCK